MQIGNIVLRLRDTVTFTDLIGGAADYEWARNQTLEGGSPDGDMAFVIPFQEIADRNESDVFVEQTLLQRFSVIVAVRNDTNIRDKTGFIAYNKLNAIRQELFESLLGLPADQLDTSGAYSDASLIYFYNGQLLDINRGYLWWQYIFEYEVILEQQAIELSTDYFDTLRTQIVLAPSDNLPISEDLPVTSFTPDAEEELNLNP